MNLHGRSPTTISTNTSHQSAGPPGSSIIYLDNKCTLNEYINLYCTALYKEVSNRTFLDRFTITNIACDARSAINYVAPGELTVYGPMTCSNSRPMVLAFFLAYGMLQGVSSSTATTMRRQTTTVVWVPNVGHQSNSVVKLLTMNSRNPVRGRWACLILLLSSLPIARCFLPAAHLGTKNKKFVYIVSLAASTYSPPDFSVVGEEGDQSRQDDTFVASTNAPEAGDKDDWYSDQPEWQRSSSSAGKNRAVRGGQSVPRTGSSWMNRNEEFARNDSPKYRGSQQTSRPNRNRNEGGPVRTFREDFRGTRVFVQGLPPQASWQDVKDHFRIAGSVVFASVSSDIKTGESKCCGIVQFETTEMAMTAMAIMRNHPMGGHELFVREDVQESKDGAQFASRTPQMKKGPTPPTKWKCADESNADHLSDDEIKSIRSLIKARDDARRRRQYDASDNLREELKQVYNVQLDDRLRMWWVSVDGKQVPQSIRDAKGDGRWGAPPAWRQIPSTPESDACVNPDLVNGLLAQRDIARREKDFATADALLLEARNSPDGDLSLRIHDESRTWRIWTDEPPPRPVDQQDSRPRRQSPGRQSPAEQCLAIAEEFAPDRIEEIRVLLEKFEGREYQILKKLRQRYIEQS